MDTIQQAPPGILRYGLKSGQFTPLETRAAGDMAALRPSFEKLGQHIGYSAIAHTAAKPS